MARSHAVGRRHVLALLALVPLAALTGCANGGGDVPSQVSAIPAEWLTSTAQGWPDSDGFGAAMPVLGAGDCLLGGSPAVLDATPRLTDVGWGAFGPDAEDTESYRYLCSLWSPDRFSGQLQLIQAASEDDLGAMVADFTSRSGSDTQDVAHTEVTSHGASIPVIATWRPTNPQGSYEALFVDEAARAAVVLEVNSLSEADFDALGDQGAADALMSALAAASRS